MVKVDELDHRIDLAAGLVHIHLRLHQKFVHRLVGIQQRAIGLAQQLLLQLVELARSWAAQA